MILNVTRSDCMVRGFLLAQSSSVIVPTGPGRALAFWWKTVVSDCPMLFAGLMFGPLCCGAEPRGQQTAGGRHVRLHPVVVCFMSAGRLTVRSTAALLLCFASNLVFCFIVQLADMYL